jgi:hypothetical protein
VAAVAEAAVVLEPRLSLLLCQQVAAAVGAVLLSWSL